MKTLRVCLANDLPPLLERDNNYIYFAYDKLLLFAGQNTLYENFAIVDTMPQSPVIGMMYIYDTDGSIHIWSNYTDNKVATIENSSMIQYIQKAGTMFYVNVNKRYVDSQRRVLTLPYNDGTYELTTSMQKEQMFTNDTILKYDENAEEFKIYGPLEDELIDYSKEFHGVNSNTVIMTVDGPRLVASVKISKRVHNAIKAASDGLYVYIDDKLDRETFEEFANMFMDFRTGALGLLERVSTELDYLEDIVSKETVTAEIMDILRERYATIDQALADYNAIIDQLNALQTSLMSYATTVFGQTEERINQTIEDNTNWYNLSSISGGPYDEINYYEIAEQTVNPDVINETNQILMNAALMSYLG